MRVALIGNFEPEFSTENELCDAMRRLDWDVWLIQSGDRPALETLVFNLRLKRADVDVIVWIRTASLWEKFGTELQWRLLAEARRRNIPVVGYHLDRWWGLKRQSEITQGLESEPFFHCDLLITADGGHQPEWAAEGIDHVWFPPAVSERWCQPGEFKEELATDIVFVGSWQGGYHREWGHRAELVAWLQKNYGSRVAFYPKQGEHAVRGLALNDVYWSAKVVVGDSCLAPKVDGSPMTHYISDRVPETVGRGGYLLHPGVEGINLGPGDPFWTPERPVCDHWSLDDWGELQARIDGELDETQWSLPGERQHRIDFIQENHTYTVRMLALEELLKERGML